LNVHTLSHSILWANKSNRTTGNNNIEKERMKAKDTRLELENTVFD